MLIGYNMKDRYQRARTDKPYGRLPAPIENWSKRNVYVKYPLWFYPRIKDPLAYCEQHNIKLPISYYERELGNMVTGNCGGTCFKAGTKYWRGAIYFNLPNFMRAMVWENKMRSNPKYADYAILTRTIDGVKKPYPLVELFIETMRADRDKPKQLRMMFLDDIESDCIVECNIH